MPSASAGVSEVQLVKVVPPLALSEYSRFAVEIRLDVESVVVTRAVKPVTETLTALGVPGNNCAVLEAELGPWSVSARITTTASVPFVSPLEMVNELEASDAEVHAPLSILYSYPTSVAPLGGVVGEKFTIKELEPEVADMPVMTGGVTARGTTLVTAFDSKLVPPGETARNLMLYETPGVRPVIEIGLVLSAGFNAVQVPDHDPFGAIWYS